MTINDFDQCIQHHRAFGTRTRRVRTQSAANANQMADWPVSFCLLLRLQRLDDVFHRECWPGPFRWHVWPAASSEHTQTDDTEFKVTKFVAPTWSPFLATACSERQRTSVPPSRSHDGFRLNSNRRQVKTFDRSTNVLDDPSVGLSSQLYSKNNFPK